MYESTDGFVGVVLMHQQFGLATLRSIYCDGKWPAKPWHSVDTHGDVLHVLCTSSASNDSIHKKADKLVHVTQKIIAAY